MSHVRWMLLLLALAAGGCGSGGAAGPKDPAEPSEADSGMRLTYEVEGGASNAAAVAEVMQKRFAALRVAGVTGVSARADGAKVLIEFSEPREDLVERVRGVASRQGRMTFYIADDDAEAMRALAKHVGENQVAKDLEITAETVTSLGAGGEERKDVYLTAEDRDEIFTEAEGRRLGCWRPDMPIRGGGKVSCSVTGRVTIERYVEQVATAGGPKIPADHTLIFQHTSRTGWRTYYTERTDALAGSRFSAEVYEGDDSTQHTMVTFDDNGKRIFGEKTTAHVGDQLVIALDGEVLTALPIDAPITDGRLILPPTSRRNAEDLATILANGLPAAVKEARKAAPAGEGEGEGEGENPLLTP